MLFQLKATQFIPVFPKYALEPILKAILFTLFIISNGSAYADDLDVKDSLWIPKCFMDTCRQLDKVELILAKKKEKTQQQEEQDARSIIQNYLKEITLWYAALNFKNPKVEIYNKRYAFFLYRSCSDQLGAYTVEDEKLYIDPFRLKNIHDIFLASDSGEKVNNLRKYYGKESVNDPECMDTTVNETDSDLLTPIVDQELLMTMSHELFHALQANNDYFRAFMINTDANWIVESTAEAASWAWAASKLGTIGVSVRNYDNPLYEAEDKASDYNTALFWLFLGKKLNSSHKIKYLNDFLTIDFSDEYHGLEKIDDQLEKIEGKTEETKSLYDFYPIFVGERLNSEIFYNKLEKVSISHPGGEIEKTIFKKGEVKSVAAQATKLKVKVPDGFVGELEIKLKDDHENLHLSVESKSYSRQPDSSRNVASISDPGGKDEYLIRVANIAEKVSDTKPLKYELEITLRPFVFCEKNRLSGPEIVSTSALTDIKPGKGEMTIGGSVSGKGKICSDVVTGVPTFVSGALGSMTMTGKIVSFLLYTPVTPQIEFKGNFTFPWPNHVGVGGWKPNSRYEIAVKIDGVEWKQLKKGKTYPATVRAMAWEWQGDVTEYINKYAQKINLLTGSRTQNFPLGKPLNGSIKILDKGRLKNGAIMIKAEIAGIEKFPKNTFTTSSTIATTRNDGYQYEKKNGFTNKDTIIVKSTAIIYCDAYYCKKRRKKIKK